MLAATAYAQNSLPPCWAIVVVKLHLSGELVLGSVGPFFFFYILTDFCYGYETFLHENKQVVSEVLTLTCLRAFRVLFLALYGSLECLIVQLLSMTIR